MTSVGGTSLTKSTTNTRGWTEGAWSSGGSSCSLYQAKPSWQTNSACSKRAASDVSAVGDPNTGLAVYNAGSGGWIIVGGTSASSPFVAGVYALYGLSGQGPSYAYSHPANFFDVTTGKNGTCTTALCKGRRGLGRPDGHGHAERHRARRGLHVYPVVQWQDLRRRRLRRILRELRDGSELLGRGHLHRVDLDLRPRRLQDGHEAEEHLRQLRDRHLLAGLVLLHHQVGQPVHERGRVDLRRDL